MRSSSRLAFASLYALFAVALVLTWRRVGAAPEGQLVWLGVAAAAGFTGLGLLAWWLRDYEQRR